MIALDMLILAEFIAPSFFTVTFSRKGLLKVTSMKQDGNYRLFRQSLREFIHLNIITRDDTIGSI